MLLLQNQRRLWIQPSKENKAYHLSQKGKVGYNVRRHAKQLSLPSKTVNEKRNKVLLKDIDEERQFSTGRDSFMTKKFKNFSPDDSQDLKSFRKGKSLRDVFVFKKEGGPRKMKGKRLDKKKEKKVMRFPNKENKRRQKERVHSTVQTNKNSLDHRRKDDGLGAALLRLEKILGLYQNKLVQLRQQKEYYRIQWLREKKRQQ